MAELSEPAIQMRGGCFCNQGACLEALQCEGASVKKWFEAGHVCGDSLDVVDGERTGVLRVSFGRESTWEDMDSVVNFFKAHFFCSGGRSVGKSAGGEVSLKRGGGDVKLKAIYVYPIKSCAAMEVKGNWPIELNGNLKFDREFCLVDASGVAMRLNRYPRMATIKSTIDLDNNSMTITAEGHTESLKLDLEGDLGGQTDAVSVCSNVCRAYYVENVEYSIWFESVLKVKCFLARRVKGEGCFSNEAPLLLISSGSVRRLNSFRRGNDKLEVNEISFRPNLVVDDGELEGEGEGELEGGCSENMEDGWSKIRIGEHREDRRFQYDR